MLLYLHDGLYGAGALAGEAGAGTRQPQSGSGSGHCQERQGGGAGVHSAARPAHAEIVALREAGAKARGASLYVTLEPCCHYGRTPPCTKAIIEAGIKEVHAAILDPNPVVCGKGKSELEKAGITVLVGEHGDEACEILEAYSRYITTHLPFVTAKFAMSLDGKIATRTGDSKWISSEESRRYVHYLRYVNDAIMVGVNTVLTDDPQLTVRCCSKGGRTHNQPLRVIVDSFGKTPVSARIFHEPGEVLMVVGEGASLEQRQAYEREGAGVLVLPSKRGNIDLPVLFRMLGERQVTSVLVEGGGTLLGSLFDRRLVDKVIVFIAPIVIGGTQAVTPVRGKGVDSVVDSIKLERVRTRSFNGDIMVSGYTGKENCLPESLKKSAL